MKDINTLYIDYGEGNHRYFDTYEKTLKDALLDFVWPIHCCVDDWEWYEIELRDKNGNIIEHCGHSSLYSIVYRGGKI